MQSQLCKSQLCKSQLCNLNYANLNILISLAVYNNGFVEIFCYETKHLSQFKR